MQLADAEDSVPRKASLTTEIFNAVITQLNGETECDAVVCITENDSLVLVNSVMQVCIIARVGRCCCAVAHQSRFDKACIVDSADLTSEQRLRIAVVGCVNPCRVITQSSGLVRVQEANPVCTVDSLRSIIGGEDFESVLDRRHFQDRARVDVRDRGILSAVCLVSINDVSAGQSSITQFGAWDVMDTGCYNNESRTPCAYSAFERASLRWLEFQDIDTPADEISLEELTQNNVAYRIRTVYDNEYFTLENRQKVGWDAYQPGTGLMIIHIDYNENTWRNNGVNSGMHPRYDLVEANGRQGSDQQNNLYPIAGNNIFTDYSTPNSLTWDGTPTEKGITDIRVEDGVVKFRFMHDRLRRPKMNEVSDITANSALLSWNAVDEAIGYRLVVNEELPDSLNPVLFDEDFSLMEEGSYPAAHYEELSTELDDHTHIPGWSGTQIYSAGGYVRIGMYGANGRLTTPHIGFSNESDSCFVAFHAVSYPGKTVNYTVSLLDENGETVESQTLKAKKTEESVVLVFHGVADGSRFRFDTQKERLFLNDLRVLSDTLSGIWNAGPREWTVDSIADTQYLLEGLAQNRTYHCKVMALATDGLTSSLFSDELQFTTLSTSGITAAPAALEREAWYDLQGRRVSQPGRGLYIRRTTGADGQTRTEKIICR